MENHTSIPSPKTHHIIVSLENYFLPTPAFKFPPGHTYELREHQLTSLDQLVERSKDVEILIINRIPLRADFLDEAVTPNLQMIHVTAVGTDSVDLEACRKRGITVTNAPGCNTSTVAEHAIGLYFSVRRKINYSHRLTQSSEWPKQGFLMCKTLDSPNGKAPRNCKDEVVGIFGYGAVGKQVATLAKALGMKVIISGRKGQPAGEGRVAFEEVLQTATVLVLTLPRTPDNIDMISMPVFEKMHSDSVLINVSRGGIVNEEALITALEKDQIAGAATDVFVVEPAGEDTTPLIGPRADTLNLVTTPHCAWCAEETIMGSKKLLEDNIAAWVAGSPINVVS